MRDEYRFDVGRGRRIRCAGFHLGGTAPSFTAQDPRVKGKYLDDRPVSEDEKSPVVKADDRAVSDAYGLREALGSGCTCEDCMGIPTFESRARGFLD